MANNCLVTKLKAFVDNDNLEKLGVVKLKIANYSKYTNVFGNENELSVISGTTSTMTLLDTRGTIEAFGGNVKIDNTHATINPGGSIRITGQESIDYFNVEIDNKYNLNKISCLYTPNTADFKYLNSIIKIKALNFEGNLDELIKNCPLLVDINVSTNATIGTYGKLSNLIGYCTNITYFGWGATRNLTTSSLEEVVAIRRGKGQTSNPGNGIRISLSTGAFTFDGEVVKPYQQWATWTPTTITFMGKTIDNDDVAVV